MHAKLMKLKTRFTTTLAALTIAGGTAAPPALNAEEKNTAFNPPIKSVVVYPDRALVTRDTRMRLKKGKHLLVFASARPSLDATSLRAFSDNRDIVVQGIGSRLERKVRTINPRIREIEKDIDVLRRRIQAKNFSMSRARGELGGINKYYQYLTKAVSEQSTANRGPKTGSADWEKARRFLIERKLRVKRTIQDLNEELRNLREQKLIASRKLNKLRAGATKTIRVVTVTVQANRTASARLGFSYMIRGAYWNVSYGMYLREDKSVFVEYYGNITQRTGEDWKNVKVSLSTSRPALGAARPKLRSMRVTGRKTATKTVVRMNQKRLAENRGPSTGKEKPGGDFSKIGERAGAAVFRIERKAVIPSGRRSHRVTVAKFRARPNEMYYRIVGRSRRAAYLAVKLPNNQAFPLLPGRTDIFRRSGFTGRASLNYTPPGGFFLVGFGLNREIRVKRKVYRSRASAGTFTSDRLFTTRIELEVSNPGSKARRVSIFERLPVSELEEIKVTVLGDTSSGYKIERKDSGILRWNRRLAPGEKVKLKLHYTVRVPKEFNIRIWGD